MPYKRYGMRKDKNIEKKEADRLSWLSATLSMHRKHIRGLLSRLKSVAVRMGDGLVLHKKFLHLIDQISDEREKEIDILREIETVEKRHLALKKKNLLRREAQKAKEHRKRLDKKAKEDSDWDDEMRAREEVPHRSNFFDYLLLFLLLSSKKDKSDSRIGFFSRLMGAPSPETTRKKPEVT